MSSTGHDQDEDRSSVPPNGRTSTGVQESDLERNRGKVSEQGRGQVGSSEGAGDVRPAACEIIGIRQIPQDRRPLLVGEARQV